ncbi:MAG: IMP cyclohydrolase [Eubacteriales bacterium]|nr:IMP cyclohydrolase [Eubacteriales bacterium]
MNGYEINDISKILKSTEYFGRGIIIGKTKDLKNAVVAYFISGRSENSKNRIFIKNNDDIIIKPFDEEKVEDPSLIIYSPIKKLGDKLIVTNGDQTDTIYEFIKNNKTFEEALKTRTFEPDYPNFTPRISGILNFDKNNFSYKMSILKSGDKEGTVCNSFTYCYESLEGIGHFIHTYNCDGNPIPSFTGEPKRIEIPNDIDEFTKLIWDNLSEKYKISLCVKYINLETKEQLTKILNINE